MRKLIIILFVVLITFAQNENQSQSIELPEFVITGKQKIDLPIMSKSKAEPVSLLSKEYFFPTFSPEQFSMATVAKPTQLMADLISEQKSYNGQLILGAGQYTLPTGEFYFSQPFSVGKFYSKLWGTNRKDFVDYADFNVSGINLGTEFYINRGSSFLPGSIINIDGSFVRKQYNFYSTFHPSNIDPESRETQNIAVSVSLKNYSSDVIKYSLETKSNQIDIKDAFAKELNMDIKGDAKLIFDSFGLIFNGEFKNQNIHKFTGDNNSSFYKALGGIEYKFSNKFSVRGGMAYFNADVSTWDTYYMIFGKVNEDLITPWGELEYSINDKLSLALSYNPNIEFLTYSDYFGLNPYVHVQIAYFNEPALDNGSTITNNKVNFSIKYAYKKYYELTAGAEYFTADKYSYFNSDFSFDATPLHSYEFKINRLDQVSSYSIYANALYHLGPFGWFYGDAKYQIVESDNNWTKKTVAIPYNPRVSLEAAYGYEFNFGISAELKLHYLKDTYADIQNDILLEDYINLSAKLRYSLTQNFDFTLHLNNLLNRDNYLWLGYLEAPLDFTAGIDFRF